LVVVSVLAPLVAPAGATSGGSWPMANGDAHRNGFNAGESTISPATAPALVRRWRVTVGVAAEMTSPALSGGVVFAQGGGGVMWAIEARTGHVLWSTPTGGTATNSSPAVAAGIVYVGASDGKLYALDARTGNLRWSAATGGSIDAAPVVADGRVVASSSDGQVRAWDAATGRLLWRAATGATSGGAAISDGTVFVPGSGVTALDLATGRTKWHVPIEVYTALSVSHGVVFVPTRNQAVFLDAHTGALLHGEDMTDFVEATPAIDGAGVVYIADTDGFLEAYDPSTGTYPWFHQFPRFKAVVGSPAIANGVLFIGVEDDGVLWAFDSSTGAALWRHAAQMASSTPAVGDGMVVVQGTSGDVTAFQPA
jgi:outer membrane protein assembly factor BamB